MLRYGLSSIFDVGLSHMESAARPFTENKANTRFLLFPLEGAAETQAVRNEPEYEGCWRGHTLFHYALSTSSLETETSVGVIALVRAR
mgnify:CR=1 FL=1